MVRVTSDTLCQAGHKKMRMQWRTSLGIASSSSIRCHPSATGFGRCTSKSQCWQSLGFGPKGPTAHSELLGFPEEGFLGNLLFAEIRATDRSDNSAH